MGKWRIKKTSCNSWEHYVLQKKLFGFLWWYNPDNFDGAITGVYGTIEDARSAYARKTEVVSVVYLGVGNES